MRRKRVIDRMRPRLVGVMEGDLLQRGNTATFVSVLGLIGPQKTNILRRGPELDKYGLFSLKITVLTQLASS